MPHYAPYLAFQMLALFTAVDDVPELPGALKPCSGLSQSQDNILGCIKLRELQALNHHNSEAMLCSTNPRFSPVYTLLSKHTAPPVFLFYIFPTARVLQHFGYTPISRPESLQVACRHTDCLTNVLSCSTGCTRSNACWSHVCCFLSTSKNEKLLILKA